MPVKVDDLVIGRDLRFPVYDEGGVLLLAEGCTVTQRFKELLKRRQQEFIQVSREDVSRLTLSVDHIREIQNPLADVSKVVEQLDAMLSSDEMFVRNAGPAVRDQRINRGCRGYCKESHEECQRHHRRSISRMDEMLQDVVSGKGLAASALYEISNQYLHRMTEDQDMVLTLVSEISSQPSIAEHCLRMATLSMSLGIEMGFDSDNVRNLAMCALTHDWGMLKISETIRNSPHALTSMDFLEIQKHPIYSLDMLEKVCGLPRVVPLVCYQVHERPNGTGYPRGRKLHLIHTFARILGVADAYIALTSRRSFRPPLMASAALECLMNMSGEGLADPAIVQSLMILLTMYPIGSFVQLSDNSVAQSIRRNGLKYNTPIVQLVKNSQGETVPPSDDAVIDLSISELRVVRPLPFPCRDEIELTTIDLDRSNHSCKS